MISHEKKDSGVHAKALKLLQDRRFLFSICQAIGNSGVIGEIQNRLVLFLAGLTRSFDHPVSVLLKGEPSTGKNALLGAVVEMFPEEHVLRRSSLTGKAPAYRKGKLAGKILYLFQYEGGKDAQFLIRLLQSEGGLEHEYTDMTRKRTHVVRQVGAPVIMTSTTSERVYVDDETRFLSLHADDSEALTRQVIRTTLGHHSKHQSAELEVIREALRILAQQRHRFRRPKWLDSLADHIPAKEPRARRDTIRFLTFLKAVALCQSFSDSRRNRRKDEAIELTPADYCVVWEILHDAFASTYRSEHPQALEVARATRLLFKEHRRPISVAELSDELGWQMPVVYKWLKAACHAGLLVYEEGTRSRNVKRVVPGPTSCSEFLPKPERLHVRGPIHYVDPLTGSERVVKTRWRGDDAE